MDRHLQNMPIWVFSSPVSHLNVHCSAHSKLSLHDKFNMTIILAVGFTVYSKSISLGCCVNHYLHTNICIGKKVWHVFTKGHFTRVWCEKSRSARNFPISCTAEYINKYIKNYSNPDSTLQTKNNHMCEEYFWPRGLSFMVLCWVESGLE